MARMAPLTPTATQRSAASSWLCPPPTARKPIRRAFLLHKTGLSTPMPASPAMAPPVPTTTCWRSGMLITARLPAQPLAHRPAGNTALKLSTGQPHRRPGGGTPPSYSTAGSWTAVTPIPPFTSHCSWLPPASPARLRTSASSKTRPATSTSLLSPSLTKRANPSP